MPPHRVLLAALLAIACPAAAQADNGPYLFVIPAERTETQHAGDGFFLQATLHVPDAGLAAAMIRAGGALRVRHIGEGEVGVLFAATPTLAGDPDDRHRNESFVIDYTEAEVLALLEQLRRRYGERPRAGDLTRFVFRHIDDKSYKASFDVASRVAATRSGDCTEHAVLLTALARATGHPARVAVGVALIESNAGLSAFGHAWAEIHDGERWQLADATLLAESAAATRVSYLPLLTLDDEGPGYAFDLARIARIQPARISGVSIQRPADASL